ncbi:MAG: hypothetical protein IKW59_04800 [Clostridia bacterium]|nr:hypothetical protein [Clostridia bacterium]
MIKKKIHFVTIKSGLLYAVLIALIILILLNAKASIEAVKGSLIVCYQTIIPSLFPFFVLSGLLINSGFVRVLGSVLNPVIRPLFRVSGSGAIVFLIGVISGYPMGAKMVTELYKKRIISKTEGKRLLPFCNNSGPLFVIAAVGIGMLRSLKTGIFLYCIHILSALLVGVIFRFYKSDVNGYTSSCYIEKESHIQIGKIFAECVSNGVNSMLLICGFIALFSSFSQCIKPLIAGFVKNECINLFINGLLEVTMGANGLAQSNLEFTEQLILMSFLIGFGGICVHLQVLGIVSDTDLGVKTYLAGKLMHSFISAIITYLSLKFISLDTVMVWSQGNFAPKELNHYRSLVWSAIIVFVLILKIRKKKFNHI